jgi:Uma2 family endonuclease
MSVINRRLTYDDLAEFPNDGKRYELIGGELLVSPAPRIAHQRLIVRLLDLFTPVRRGKSASEVFLAPTDVRFSPEDVVEPDLLVIRAERQSIVGELVIDGSPDLIVEILSPSTRTYDEVAKAALYAREGVTEYWLVDPESTTVRIFTLSGGQYEPVPHDGQTARSALFPELTVDITALFAGL